MRPCVVWQRGHSPTLESAAATHTAYTEAPREIFKLNLWEPGESVNPAFAESRRSIRFI